MVLCYSSHRKLIQLESGKVRKLFICNRKSLELVSKEAWGGNCRSRTGNQVGDDDINAGESSGEPTIMW